MRFDQFAAEDAVAALRSAAVIVEATREAEVRNLPAATQDWTGPARLEFDSASQQIRTMRARLADNLRTLARSLAVAADEAKAEQHAEARREHAG